MMGASEIQIPEYGRQHRAPHLTGQRSQGRVAVGDGGGSNAASFRRMDTGSAEVDEARITEVFEFLDTKIAGTLGLRQVRSAFTELNLQAPEVRDFQKVLNDGKHTNLEEQFRRVDTDRDGRITLLELHGWLTKKGTVFGTNSGKGEKEEVQKFFRVFADPRKNAITQTSFLRSARRFLPSHTEDLLVCMFREFQNNDSVIGMEEFVQIRKETNFF